MERGGVQAAGGEAECRVESLEEFCEDEARPRRRPTHLCPAAPPWHLRTYCASASSCMRACVRVRTRTRARVQNYKLAPACDPNATESEDRLLFIDEVGP